MKIILNKTSNKIKFKRRPAPHNDIEFTTNSGNIDHLVDNDSIIELWLPSSGNIVFVKMKNGEFIQCATI